MEAFYSREDYRRWCDSQPRGRFERVDGRIVQMAPERAEHVEVLRPGTASIDSGVKLTDYFQLPSVAHYLVADPRRRSIIHHCRTADGIHTRIVAEGGIEMDPPSITITVDEVYS